MKKVFLAAGLSTAITMPNVTHAETLNLVCEMFDLVVNGRQTDYSKFVVYDAWPVTAVDLENRIITTPEGRYPITDITDEAIFFRGKTINEVGQESAGEGNLHLYTVLTVSKAVKAGGAVKGAGEYEYQVKYKCAPDGRRRF
jgi:hypothetical protein